MRHKPTVLIVDDQPSNLHMLKEILGDMYKIMSATSGEKALELALKKPYPDIVLLDIIMPGINGFEVCKRLKENEATKEIPVVFVTVMDAEEDITMGFLIGGVDYITRPFKNDEVKARVAMHLKMRRQQKELEKTIHQLNVSQALHLHQARLNASEQLIRNIAHQWRQPLSTIGIQIQNVLESLHKGDEKSQCQIEKDLELTLETLLKLSDLISEFDTLFRPCDTKEVFELSEVLERALLFMQAELERSGIHVETRIEAGLQCEGYKHEVSRVLIMILTNAVEMLYERDTADKRIEIELKQQGEKIALCIRDNAGGVDEEILQHIFEPYVSSKFAHQGIGLSLFICKVLIERHMDGKLQVQNSEEGASFCLEMDLYRE